jgi:tetratricopeptide (TPR) repeat protein
MHKAWRKSIPAAISALGLAATTVFADPASMALHRPAPGAPAPASSSWNFWPFSKSDTPSVAVPPTAALPAASVMAQPQSVPAWQTAQLAAQPSTELSVWKHPIQYLGAKMPEMPGKSKTSTHPVMQPAHAQTDAISLSVPTGPPSPEFFIFAAQMCERQGDVPQARENLKRALSMFPNNPDVLRAAARMEDRQSNLPLAESLYQQAVSANPQNAAALNDLGLCLAREGKLEPSLQVIEQAIHLQPDKALYRNNAATVLVEMRQDQKALGHLSAVHNPAEANFNLGQLLVDRGRSTDAVPYFQVALQLNPGMTQAQDALAKINGQVQYNVAQQTPAATPPVLAPQQVAPTTGPSFIPQQQPSYGSGPQLSYPATARTPSAGASSYVVPQYMPPVAAQPGRPLQR